jgi:fructose-1,6-bisphosphatase
VKIHLWDFTIWTGGFSVAFDPLDGSSIVDTNFTVGTIFGVWPGDKLTGVKGRDQVAAAMGIYGPRTTYVLALKDVPGTHEFLLLDEGLLSTIWSNSKVLMEDIRHFFFFINWSLEAPVGGKVFPL